MALLDGVKVIDFTHAYAGPFCSMFLADYGAEVIKIERVDGGDQARAWGPFKNDYSCYYASFNRGKKSITLDISSPEGKKIIHELVTGADIVCSNFKAGTLEKFGIGYAQMKEIKPDIIYATISGFGTKGALSRFAAYDNVIQAMSGIMDVNGFPDKAPTKIGPAIGDSYSGLLLLLGIMTAYRYRQLTGKGQQVDVTMLGALFGLLEYPVLEYANKGNVLTRNGNKSCYSAPNDVYRTKDDYVAVSVRNEAEWETFCGITGIEAGGQYSTMEKRLQDIPGLTRLIEDCFAYKTAHEVEAMFEETNVPVSAMMGIYESLTNPQLLEREMVIQVQDPKIGPLKLAGNPIRLSGEKPVLSRPSPMLGEHTDQILVSLGYRTDEILKMKEKKVV